MADRSLQPGASVWIRDRAWRIDRIRRSRAIVTLDVSAGAERRTFLSPFDRPNASSRRRRASHVRVQQAVARVAGVAAHLPAARSIDSTVSATVSLLPYQLEPALAIVAGGARRVLIADAVGLGKTIQAAYVIAEIVRREPQARVLVLAPMSLVDQWRGELSSRFRLDAVAIDRAALDDAAAHLAPGDSPWRAAGIRVVSLDFLKQPHVFDALPATSWDLLVVDEVHTACGDSDRHARLERLSARARRVVLLTATPHDGDAVKFRRLLSLGAIAAIDTPLAVFRRSRADAGLAVTRRTRRHAVTLSAAERHALDALDRFGRLAGANATGLDLLMTVLRKRAMSTMRALALSIDRRRAWLDGRADPAADLWRQSTLPFGEDDDGGADEWRALTADTGLDPRREREWLARLASLAAAAGRDESKLSRAAALLARTREPAIVFTEYRDSLEIARAKLSRLVALATLHGGQTLAERRIELHRFSSGLARVLLATDVAGVGLNLHERARWVITLDLPWNPVRLDQRIGRVDRIGQTRSVHHTILTARHTHESRLSAHLDRRAAAAQAALDPAATAPGDEGVERMPPACVAYTRVARWMARTLTQRRALAARWRSEHPALAPCRTQRRGADGGRGAILLFRAPVVDSAGGDVDVRLVVVRTPESLDAAAIDRVIRDSRAAVARLIRARAARLTRWSAIAGRPGRLRDAAIAEALRSTAAAAVEVGLFDRREWRAHADARNLARHDSCDERRRQRARQAGAAFQAGPPELLCVVDGAR